MHDGVEDDSIGHAGDSLLEGAIAWQGLVSQREELWESPKQLGSEGHWIYTVLPIYTVQVVSGGI